MKHVALPVTVLAALTLAACSNPQDTAMPEPANTPATSNDTVEPLKLGEEFTITNCNGGEPCEVNVKFSNIALTEACPDGANDYSDTTTATEDTIYLTVEGEYEVVKSPTNYSISEMDFDATTSDGVSHEPEVAYDCKSPDVDESLDNPVDQGMKRVGKLTMAIDRSVNTLRFSPMWEQVSREFDLSQLNVEPGEADPTM